MKKSLSFIAVLMLFGITNFSKANTSDISIENDILRRSCFTMAREITIIQDDEINIDNVQHVLDLTEYLRSTGVCN